MCSTQCPCLCIKLIGCWQFNAIGRPVLSSPSAARPLLPPLTPDRSSRRWLASTLVALRTPGSSRNQTGYSWLRLVFDDFFRVSRGHVAPHASCDVFFLVPMLMGRGDLCLHSDGVPDSRRSGAAAHHHGAGRPRCTATATLLLNRFQVFSSAVPPHTLRVACSTWCPC